MTKKACFSVAIVGAVAVMSVYVGKAVAAAVDPYTPTTSVVITAPTKATTTAARPPVRDPLRPPLRSPFIP